MFRWQNDLSVTSADIRRHQSIGTIAIDRKVKEGVHLTFFGGAGGGGGVKGGGEGEVSGFYEAFYLSSLRSFPYRKQSVHPVFDTFCK